MNLIYKLRDSVDVYYTQKSGEQVLIQFYKINTRSRTCIEAHTSVLELLCALDGTRSLGEICRTFNLDYADLQPFIDFLEVRKIIKPVKTVRVDERFKRQINFFDDLVLDKDGIECQKILENKKIIIFGLGSVGSSIAILLARMGFRNFTLIDYKRLEHSHMIKHLYANCQNIGQYKTDALKNYLHRINSEMCIRAINEKILPRTDMSALIEDDTDMVINTADEPYIGHTSKKIGQYLWDKNIAMFVGGGFDAHSMSTGEIIVNGMTETIDEYQDNFKEKLKEWKPIYTANKSYDGIRVGGSGSVSSCSLFSASCACMRIVYYFLNVDFAINKRGEYCLNKGKMQWVELDKI